MRSHPTNLLTRGLLAAAVTLLLASGCGGVDSGGTGAVAVGPITGFGSIIVNAVRFDESGAVVRDEEGTIIARDRLALGVVTEVEAKTPTNVGGTLFAVATAIRVNSELVGPVTAVDAVSGTLAVLGQSVRVTASTAFDAALPAGLASLQVGSTVEVYGRFDSVNARYTATRIEARPNPAAYKLRGPIAAVDPAAHTMIIGGQTIDTSLLPAADLANVGVGNIVRARLQTTQVGGNWLAIAVRPGVTSLPDSPIVKLEGRISAFTSTRAFSVDGIPVDASAATFPEGQAGVVLGARVEVVGSSRGGIIIAREVEVEGDELERDDSFELLGRIQAHDAAAMTFSVRGITVHYRGKVQFAGGGIGDLVPGRSVTVEGGLAADRAGITAQRIVIGTD